MTIWKCKRLLIFLLFLQKTLPALITYVRHISADSTNLRSILEEKIPKEQERVKNFRKQFGATKVGEVTVDMVCICVIN